MSGGPIPRVVPDWPDQTWFAPAGAADSSFIALPVPAWRRLADRGVTRASPWRAVSSSSPIQVAGLHSSVPFLGTRPQIPGIRPPVPGPGPLPLARSRAPPPFSDNTSPSYLASVPPPELAGIPFLSPPLDHGGEMRTIRVILPCQWHHCTPRHTLYYLRVSGNLVRRRWSCWKLSSTIRFPHSPLTQGRLLSPAAHRRPLVTALKAGFASMDRARVARVPFNYIPLTDVVPGNALPHVLCGQVTPGSAAFSCGAQVASDFMVIACPLSVRATERADITFYHTRFTVKLKVSKYDVAGPEPTDVVNFPVKSPKEPSFY